MKHTDHTTSPDTHKRSLASTGVAGSILKAVCSVSGRVMRPLAPTTGGRHVQGEMVSTPYAYGEGVQLPGGVSIPLDAVPLPPPSRSFGDAVTAREVAEAAAAPLLQRSPFTEVVSIKTRMEQLGQALMELKRRREFMAELILGSESDVFALEAPPQEAGVGEWLDYMTAYAETETKNINRLIEAL